MFEEIKELLVELASVDEHEVLPDANLQSLGIDSIYAVELILELEEHYNIKIETEEMLKLKIVSDVVKLVESKVKK